MNNEQQELIEWIVGFCDHYGLAEYRNYSGRGMYGKQCVAIVAKNGYASVGLLTYHIWEQASEEARAEWEEILHDTHSDNMGTNVVIYWPKLQVQP